VLIFKLFFLPLSVI
jgi:hypothetical protein